MRDTEYFLVFDGFAHWHRALALCEVRRPSDWRSWRRGASAKRSRPELMAMAIWLEYLVAARRPLSLRGQLLDGPCHFGATKIRRRVVGGRETRTGPAAGIIVEPMVVSPTRLESSP